MATKISPPFPYNVEHLIIKRKIVCELIEYCEKLNILFIDKTNAMAIVTKKGHCEMCIMTKKRKLWQKGCK